MTKRGPTEKKIRQILKWSKPTSASGEKSTLLKIIENTFLYDFQVILSKFDFEQHWPKIGSLGKKKQSWVRQPPKIMITELDAA